MKTNIKVAGTTFYAVPVGAGIKIERELPVGDCPCALTTAVLKPEPENKHDENAVAVYIELGTGNAHKIGYLPKNEPLKTQITHPVLAALLIKDYGQVGALFPSYVLVEIRI